MAPKCFNSDTRWIKSRRKAPGAGWHRQELDKTCFSLKSSTFEMNRTSGSKLLPEI